MRLRLIQNRLGVGRKPPIDEDPLCQLVMAGKSPNSTQVVCCWENHRWSSGVAGKRRLALTRYSDESRNETSGEDFAGSNITSTPSWKLMVKSCIIFVRLQLGFKSTTKSIFKGTKITKVREEMWTQCGHTAKAISSRRTLLLESWLSQAGPEGAVAVAVVASGSSEDENGMRMRMRMMMINIIGMKWTCTGEHMKFTRKTHIKCRGSCRFSQWRWLLGTAASVAGVVALSIQAAGPVVRNGSRFQASWEYQLEAVLKLRYHQVSPCLDYTGVNHVKSSSQ